MNLEAQLQEGEQALAHIWKVRVAAFALVTGVTPITFALELRRALAELGRHVRPTARPVTQ